MRSGAAALLLAPLLCLASCSNQGEGERCTLFNGGDAGENGTSECSAGLVCTVTAYYTPNVSTTGVGTLGVCCPPSGTASTAPACNQTTGGSTTGGPPAGDGGFDGATDSSVDGKARDAAGDGHASKDAHESKDAPPSSDGSHAADAHGDAAPATKDAANDAVKDAPVDTTRSG
jgi:hypothetical protein